VNAEQSQTFEVTTPSEREVVMTRTFNAKRARVFSAFTEPELIKRWFDIAGWTMASCEVDLRPGGKFHYHWRNDENGANFLVTKVYSELFTQYAMLRPASKDAPDAESIRVKVSREDEGMKLPGYTFTQDSQEF